MDKCNKESYDHEYKGNIAKRTRFRRMLVNDPRRAGLPTRISRNQGTSATSYLRFLTSHGSIGRLLRISYLPHLLTTSPAIGFESVA